MRQIRHIVPGIYNREIKKATNYVRRTNGNKNRNPSIRTTYSSGGSSTSVPNIKVNSLIEDSKDDFIFTIDSSYLVNGNFEMMVGPITNKEEDIIGLNKIVYIDWGDGKIEQYMVKKAESDTGVEFKTHNFKDKKKYQIKIHHKDFPILTGYDKKSNRIDIPDSILSIEQWGLCAEKLPQFDVSKFDKDSGLFLYHGMENLQKIPPLPYPYITDFNFFIGFQTMGFKTFAWSHLKTLPKGFFENIVLFAKEHPKFVFNLSGLFIDSKIETLPEDLFKPFADFSSKNIYLKCLFGRCPIKDIFPPKYQPLDWKTQENMDNSWSGIFAGCNNIPNFKEIPPILRDDTDLDYNGKPHF